MNKEIKIDIKRCFGAILVHWWIVVISAIIFYTAAYVYTYKINNDMYEAKTTVYSVAGGSYQEAVEAAYIMTTYSDIITSLKISERAASMLDDKNLDGYNIQKMIHVKYNSSSTVLEIYADSPIEDQAVRVANAVANAFIIEISTIMGDNSVQLLDSAKSAKIAINGQFEQLKIRFLGVVAAVILSSLCIALFEVFTTKIYDVSDILLDGELKLIGIIPSYEKNKGDNV